MASLSWRAIERVRTDDEQLSFGMFRSEPARYVHADHLARLSPMLADPDMSRRLAGHERVFDDLSRYLIQRFELAPLDNADVEVCGRHLALLGDRGSLRLLLVGACLLAEPIRLTVTGQHVAWLTNLLSWNGYLAVLDHARSLPSDQRGRTTVSLSAVSSEDALLTMLEDTARQAFCRWLARLEPSFRQRVTLMLPANADLTPMSSDEVGSADQAADDLAIATASSIALAESAPTV